MYLLFIRFYIRQRGGVGLSYKKLDWYKMKNRPLLSVVMPVHNPRQYLSPCLDSVLQQTFRDFELIAIDDASTDDSLSILKQYASLDKRLQVMHNEKSLGAACTRNRGLYAARGEYIIFLDADDYFELDYFENMIAKISSTKADVAICPILLRDERDGTESFIPKNISQITEIVGKSVCPDKFVKRLFYGMPYAPFNKLVRREMLIEKRIEFQDLNNSNDVYFGVITIAEANTVVCLPKPYVHYRYNTGTQISTKRYKKAMCICYAFQKIREELIARGLWGKFSCMYYDLSVLAIYSVLKKAYEPQILLDYVQGEGKVQLGFNNLCRYEFSSARLYGLYKILIYGRYAILGNRRDIFSCILMAFKWGDLLGIYWLLGHYIMLTMRGLKKYLKV
ncbi:MAG: glycosyltransferase family 2 protein [Selenomonas ruminantium]|jgi:glycosyltransferase involved in cell wall biosynthesis|nr:glycosyltransferase family 2 protein [Selenomonas ruminantium]